MTPLYLRILGDRWGDLPAPVRALHNGVTMAEGEADVERGINPLARLGAQVFGFPRAGRAVPLRVIFDADERGETWTRQFGALRLSSRQRADSHEAGLFYERFGLIEFAMTLELRDEEMHLIHRGWRVLGVPLPQWLAPRFRAHESAENGVFRFFVEISHPLCGLIVRYNGWLKPQPFDLAAGTARLIGRGIADGR